MMYDDCSNLSLNQVHKHAISACLQDIQNTGSALLLACVASGHTSLISKFSETFLTSGCVIILVATPSRIPPQISKIKRYILTNPVNTLNEETVATHLEECKTLSHTFTVFVGSYTIKSHLELCSQISPSLIIYQEAHMLGDYLKEIEQIKDLCPYLGIMTSPLRVEQADISSMFYKESFKISVEHLMNAGIIPQIQATTVPTPISLKDLSINKQPGGEYDYSAKELTQVLNNPTRNSIILNVLKDNPNKKGRTMIICLNALHAESLATHIRRSGDVKATPITKDTPNQLKKTILTAYHEGRITTLITDDYLFERYENPHVNQLIIARPTYSSFIYQNMLAQGLRTNKDTPNKTCQLFDIRDKHSKTVGISRLFGMPSRLVLENTNGLTLRNEVADPLKNNPLLFNLPTSVITLKTIYNSLCQRTLLGTIEASPLLEIDGHMWFEFDTHTWTALWGGNRLTSVKKTPIGTYALHDGMGTRLLNSNLNGFINQVTGELTLQEALSKFNNSLTLLTKSKNTYPSSTLPTLSSFDEKPTEAQLWLLKRYSIPSHAVTTKGKASMLLYKLQILEASCKETGRIYRGKYFGFPAVYVYLLFPTYVQKFPDYPTFKQLNEHPNLITKWLQEYKPHIISKISQQAPLLLTIELYTEFKEHLHPFLQDDIEYKALQRRIT